MNYERKPVNRFTAILFLALLGIILWFLTSCTTIAPKPVHDRVASYDGSYQNSGVLSAVEGGFIVTPKFRDRYNALIELYGSEFTPDLQKDEGMSKRNVDFFIDSEHMVKFLDMNQWKKAGRKPKGLIDKVRDKVGI
jgi:hypothetical protein